MLIGFAVDEFQSGAQVPDLTLLKRLGCERVFTPAEGVFSIEDVIPYLRSGDVLAITALSRLGDDVERIVVTTARLHQQGIRLHVVGTDVVPGTALGETFVAACSILSDFVRTHKSQQVSESGRSRGRPVALQPDMQRRAAGLLKSGTSVNQVARLLKVSAATVYRYFPRRRRQDDEPGMQARKKPPVRPRPRSPKG